MCSVACGRDKHAKTVFDPRRRRRQMDGRWFLWMSNIRGEFVWKWFSFLIPNNHPLLCALSVCLSVSQYCGCCLIQPATLTQSRILNQVWNSGYITAKLPLIQPLLAWIHSIKYEITQPVKVFYTWANTASRLLQPLPPGPKVTGLSGTLCIYFSWSRWRKRTTYIMIMMIKMFVLLAYNYVLYMWIDRYDLRVLLPGFPCHCSTVHFANYFDLR